MTVAIRVDCRRGPRGPWHDRIMGLLDDAEQQYQQHAELAAQLVAWNESHGSYGFPLGSLDSDSEFAEVIKDLFARDPGGRAYVGRGPDGEWHRVSRGQAPDVQVAAYHSVQISPGEHPSFAEASPCG